MKKNLTVPTKWQAHPTLGFVLQTGNQKISWILLPTPTIKVSTSWYWKIRQTAIVTAKGICRLKLSSLKHCFAQQVPPRGPATKAQHWAAAEPPLPSTYPTSHKCSPAILITAHRCFARIWEARQITNTNSHASYFRQISPELCTPPFSYSTAMSVNNSLRALQKSEAVLLSPFLWRSLLI